ncbi:hypothetical protein PSP6_160227 [Paraburkholderia tropica]|nr:hypothetical protein PSP6_160227 [Paraburkholderia tropica]
MPWSLHAPVDCPRAAQPDCVLPHCLSTIHRRCAQSRYGGAARVCKHICKCICQCARIRQTPVERALSRVAQRVLQCGILNSVQAMLECDVTGLLAWWGGQPGQVGNEAATAVFRQCRGSGSSPSLFFWRLFF